MRLGLIVDGRAEFAALPKLIPGLTTRTGAIILRPIKADLQPHAPAGAIARACRPALMQLEGRGVGQAVVLIDHETRPQCPGVWAADLQAELVRVASLPVTVVVKNRMFENWLLADLDALAQQRARFSVSRQLRTAVEPNKADHVTALDLIKRAAQSEYDKVRDATRILERADIDRMAAHSRSFRRFLRVLDCAPYCGQSRAP